MIDMFFCRKCKEWYWEEEWNEEHSKHSLEGDKDESI